MHFTVLLLCLLSTGALALPGPIESKRQFSYNGPLGPAEACPSDDQRLLSGHSSTMVGAPPNFPNYQCLPWSTSADLIGINLLLSNASAIKAYSDPNCADRISYILTPPSLYGGDGQFCALQSENGGAGSWRSVQYAP